MATQQANAQPQHPQDNEPQNVQQLVQQLAQQRREADKQEAAKQRQADRQQFAQQFAQLSNQIAEANDNDLLKDLVHLARAFFDYVLHRFVRPSHAKLA